MLRFLQHAEDIWNLLPRGDSQSPQQESKAMFRQLPLPQVLFAALATPLGVSKAQIQAPRKVIEKQKAENQASIRDPVCLI